MTEKMRLITETYYNDLMSLKDRLSLDGSGVTDEQDYIALTYVLDAIEEAKQQQEETSQYARKIAAFIYATAVLEQEESNWVIYQSEIEERFEELPEGWAHDEQMLADIEQELSQYPGLDGAEFTIDQDDEGEVYFDIMLWTDYIASDYNAE